MKPYKRIFDMIYPVGSIYMSVNNTNPSELFGGTWVSWGSGKVPVGVNSSETEFNTVEKTGGEKEHKLTINEIPSHNHEICGWNYPGITGEVSDVTHLSSTNRMNEKLKSTENIGGSQSHNNLQPYITCYMWKRTA